MDHSAILRHLDTASAKKLDRCSRTRLLEPHEFLSFAGEPPRRVHLIHRGIFKQMAVGPRGDELIVAVVGEGTLVGELAAIDEEPEEVDTVALTPATVTSFDGRIFREVTTTNPRATQELALSIAARHRLLLRRFLDTRSSHVPQRLAAALLDLAEVTGRMRGGTIEMELPFTQGELGNLAGMCRETACKGMARMRRANLLAYRGKQLRILRPDVLEKLRCGANRGVVGR